MADQPLVDADAAEETQPQGEDDREFAVAGRAHDALQADLLVSYLEEQGLEAFVDADRDGMVEKLSAPADGFPIRVPAKDLEKAAGLLAERKAALEEDPEAASRAAEEESAKSEAEG